MNKALQLVIAVVLAALVSTAVFADVMNVSDVHAQRTDLAGKKITVTGKVIKVNNGIMRRNFIHVQDGSGSGDTANLIFTSQQTAVVGDKITATGTVVLDTDFGMGYFYATLVEEATLELAAHP